MSRFTDVQLTDEQYLKLAEEYEEASLYSAAVRIYRKIGLKHKPNSVSSNPQNKMMI